MLQAEGLSPGLSVQASLPRVTAQVYCSQLGLLPSSQGQGQEHSEAPAGPGPAIGVLQAGRPAGGLSGQSHPAAEQLRGGTARAQAHRGHQHSDGVLSHCRHWARVEVL